MLKIRTILLLLGMILITSNSINIGAQLEMTTTNGDTLYVGGSGQGNYSKIQDAIDNASSGDTIFVFNGTYYEHHIYIDKTVNLIGENKGTTIIDGDNGGDIVIIGADGVYLSGFTIQRAGNINDNGIFIYNSNNCTIKNNNVLLIKEDGIWLFRTNNTTITNNTITKITGTGLMLTLSSNALIMDNNISNNGAGIGLDEVTNSLVTNNMLSNNYLGIYLGNLNHFFGYNTITGNNILHNKQCGIDIYLSYSNKIEKNNFIGNKRHAKFETAFKNSWDANYWGKSRLFPKPIFGIITRINFPLPIPIPIAGNGFPIIGIQFDWNPVQEPYDIS
ncbi:MAG: right-handed parallel beta-helix repeat-containing protein [Thermoplasmatales archaeon]|nr:MAG: right-handed parallel beta-helix repeat-containing protein [Thermoplasmatales archaeon]